MKETGKVEELGPKNTFLVFGGQSDEETIACAVFIGGTIKLCI
jgi:hypothetical protein